MEQIHSSKIDNNKISAKLKVKNLCFDSIYHLKDTTDPSQLMRNYWHIEKSVEKDYGAFRDYIKNALTTADKKESVGARFKKIDKFQLGGN